MDLRLATMKAVSFYLLHNVSTLNQCRKLSCGTVVCKHFASSQGDPNYRRDLIWYAKGQLWETSCLGHRLPHATNTSKAIPLQARRGPQGSRRLTGSQILWKSAHERCKFVKWGTCFSCSILLSRRQSIYRFSARAICLNLPKNTRTLSQRSS
jgi:hypothetical protein